MRNHVEKKLHFLYCVPKDGMMPTVCELQGKECLLNISQDTLITSAAWKMEQATSGGLGSISGWGGAWLLEDLSAQSVQSV